MRHLKTKKLKYFTADNYPKHFDIPIDFLWDGDATISIFIRDMLKKFLEHNIDVPQEYVDLTNGNEELGFLYYMEDIEKLIVDFDFIADHCRDTDIDIKPRVKEAFEKLAKIYPTLWI